MRLVRKLFVLAGLSFALLAGAPAAALDPTRRVSQHKHTVWTIDDGAPAGILALTQGVDGYLWIGARDGLFRFDGLRFEKILPRDLCGKAQA